MKIFKAFLLVLIVPLLANFATYSIWGKSSLRKRNISALMTSDFENPGDEINMDYMMWSDLNYQDSILLKGKVFPLFKVDNTGNLDDKDEVIKSLQYADSVQFIKRFIAKHEVLNELTKEDLEVIFSDTTVYIEDRYFEKILIGMPDSLNLIPQTQNYRGVCEPLGQNALDCMIWGNLVGLLIEDIHSWYPFYVEQEITANWYGSDYSGDFRIERLVWFFFTWVQIDLVNENGLQGDDV